MAREVKEVNPEQDRLLDELLRGKTPEQILGEHGLIKQMTKRLVERALQAELTAHLGYDPHEKAEVARENARNGTGTKTVLTDAGALPIEVPRDRAGSFAPQLVKKRQRRLQGFDDKVISLYARGMTTREIQGHLQERYGTEVSPTLISAVTEAVIDDLKAWQARPLKAVYPIVYFDCLFVKSRQEGPVVARAVYLAACRQPQGREGTPGVVGRQDRGGEVLVERGSPSSRTAGCRTASSPASTGCRALPRRSRQCSRRPRCSGASCTRFAPRSNTSPGRSARPWPPTFAKSTPPPRSGRPRPRLRAFAEAWDAKYPAIARAWRADWTPLTAFFDYPPEIRKVIYTTNAIESLNHSLRKVIKNRGAFPDDEAVMKLLYLALTNVAKRWTMPVRDWSAARNQFMIPRCQDSCRLSC
jgi:putative transposase